MGVFQLFAQHVSLFPVPNASDEDKARFAQHEKVRHRLREDSGSPGVSLNQKLTAWWTFDFCGLRRELVKVFHQDIPVKERDEWQAWFEAQKEAHRGRTASIVVRETDLTARVYALFALEKAEIALIEAATKYQYGEG